MKKFLDIRRCLRLTVAEGRLLLALLDDAKGREAKSARAKLATAVEMATHTCRGKVCPVCKQSPQQTQRLKEHRAKLFKERLEQETHTRRAMVAERNRDAITRVAPLKLAQSVEEAP